MTADCEMGSGAGPETPNRTALPLTMVSEGQEIILRRIDGGRKFAHRMAEMGLTPGVKFRVLRCSRPGPFIITVKDHRLVLGRGMVHRIFVAPQ